MKCKKHACFSEQKILSLKVQGSSHTAINIMPLILKCLCQTSTCKYDLILTGIQWNAEQEVTFCIHPQK